MVYEDNGVGFPEEFAANQSGTGLQNISNRVSFLNGTMTIESSSHGLKMSFLFKNLLP